MAARSRLILGAAFVYLAACGRSVLDQPLDDGGGSTGGTGGGSTGGTGGGSTGGTGGGDCPPAMPNEFGVGKRCLTGNDCKGLPRATFCTCDAPNRPPGLPCFCTVAGLGTCPSANVCGTGAKCCGMMVFGTSAYACIPTGCRALAGCP